MTAAEILGEIKALPAQEQSRIYDALKEIILREANSLVGLHQGDLARAARALRSDYELDSELTAFTALDGEDFHASR
jgi:hypothetical protein